MTRLCGVVNKYQVVYCSNKVRAQLGRHTHFVDDSGSCNVVSLSRCELGETFGP